MFGKHWTTADGRIVDKRVLHSNGDGMASHEYVVEVTTASAEVFRAKASEPRLAMDFKEPFVGDTIGIEYDEKSRDIRFDKDDPRLSIKAYRKAKASSFDDALHAAPGTPTGGSAAIPSSGIDIGALLKAQGIDATGRTPQVIQMDGSSPEGAAVRDALLRALGQQPPATETPDQTT